MEQQDIREMRVGEVMHNNWPTLRPDDTVEAAIKLFAENRITGCPVVEDGEIIGIITEGDLIFQDADIKSPGFLEILGGMVPLGNWDEYREEALKSAGVSVEELMSDNPTSIGPDTTLAEAATIMAEQRFKILPVVADGGLQGVISRMDILTLHVLKPRS